MLKSGVVAAMAAVAAFGVMQFAGSAMAGAQSFTITSKNFKDGEMLPAKHAGNNKANPNCVGDNVSPELSWSNVPAGTKSFALVMVDPATGAELWRYAPPFVVEGIASAPAVDGRQAVFVTQAGYVVSLLAPGEAVTSDTSDDWVWTSSTQPPRLGGATSRLGGRAATPAGGAGRESDDPDEGRPDPIDPNAPDAPPQPGDVESPR